MPRGPCQGSRHLVFRPQAIVPVDKNEVWPTEKQLRLKLYKFWYSVKPSTQSQHWSEASAWLLSQELKPNNYCWSWMTSTQPLMAQVYMPLVRNNSKIYIINGYCILRETAFYESNRMKCYIKLIENSNRQKTSDFWVIVCMW